MRTQIRKDIPGLSECSFPKEFPDPDRQVVQPSEVSQQPTTFTSAEVSGTSVTVHSDRLNFANHTVDKLLLLQICERLYCHERRRGYLRPCFEHGDRPQSTLAKPDRLPSGRPTARPLLRPFPPPLVNTDHNTASKINGIQNLN